MLNKEYLFSLAMIAVSLYVSADFQLRQTTNGDSKCDAQTNVTLECMTSQCDYYITK